MIDARVRSIFDKANFIQLLGIKLTATGDNWCEAHMTIREEYRQQHGLVHAGVLATMADHTAGGAARAVSGERDVITVGFNINFLRAAKGNELRCRAHVIKAGSRIIVVESEVFSREAGKEVLVTKLTETLAVIDQA